MLFTNRVMTFMMPGMMSGQLAQTLGYRGFFIMVLFCVIAIGYGKTGGVEHRSRPMSELCRVQGDMPEWFRKGMEAAMLAPTAVNQQKFLFTLDNDTVTAERTGGMYSLVDLGIVKYHFEVGSGKEGLFRL